MAGLAIAVIVVAGVGFALSWANKKSKERARTWQVTAERLGLSFRHGPHSGRPIHARHLMSQMYGQHDGQDVYVGVRTYTTGSGKNRTTHYRTFVDVVFDVPLARGVQIARADGVSKFFGDLFGQRDIQIGDEAFDRDFRVKGLEPEQLVGLLSSERLRAVLSRQIGSFSPNVNDDRVRFEAVGIHVDASALQPVLPAAVEAYREVLSAWRSLPATVQEAQVEPAWRAVATRADLDYQARGMTALGRCRAGDVRASVRLGQKGWVTRVAIAFDPPLGTGLRLTHEGVMSGLGKLFGAQDVRLDDAPFDRAFVVKAEDEAKVHRVLVADARARLVSLREVADEVGATDDHVAVEVHRIVDDGALLARLIADARAAADAMVAFRRPAPTAPFR